MYDLRQDVVDLRIGTHLEKVLLEGTKAHPYLIEVEYQVELAYVLERTIECLYKNLLGKKTEVSEVTT